MKISGHKTPTIFDRYNIVDNRDIEEARKRVAEFLNGQKKRKIERDYEIDLDPVHSAIRLTVTAEIVTPQLAEDIYTRLQVISSKGGPYAAVYDMSAVKDTTIPTEMIRSYARRPPSVPMGKPHVVVGKEPAIYGLARLFEISREYRYGEFCVVHTLKAACRLAGVRPEDFTQRLEQARTCL
jgi:hypothetical protein